MTFDADGCMQGEIVMVEKSGIVFNIQHYSIHDGPGVRTNIFLKGCPLRCRWCSNPESHAQNPQLMVLHDRCVGCKACVSICKKQAIGIVDGKAVTDRSKCIACGDCVSVCAARAREIMGKRMTVAEVMEAAEEDAIFYGADGGITLSGGEILVQSEFAAMILKACKEKGFHTAVETTGYASTETISKTLQNAYLILFDCKHMDSAAHKAGTGVDNILILKNLVYLSEEMKKPLVVRVPMIHGYNDSMDNIFAMAAFLQKNAPRVKEINLLPYHNMGEGKKAQMEWVNGFYEGQAPITAHLDEIKKALRRYGFHVPE